MSRSKISLNVSALALVKQLCKEAESYGVITDESESGVTLVDAGLNAQGGFLAGEIITEICLGGYGKAKIVPLQYDDFVSPSVFVYTDHPALSTLGSQFAGWQIKADEFSAIASGPARALALKPKNLYKKIRYQEEADVAVLVLETDKKPSEDIIQQIVTKCRVSPENLFLVYFSTTSLTGSTQVSGRIVETGLHKLMNLGLDPLVVKHAWGYAPIVPLHPSPNEAMGKANDAILYGGVATYIVNHEDDVELERLVKQAPSSASKMLQEAKKIAEKSPRFFEIYKAAGFDFYKIDPDIFAPAIIIINNMLTGKVFRSGSLDMPALKGSLDI